MLLATSVAVAKPGSHSSLEATPASCQPGKRGICVVFNGRINGSQKAPHLVATSVSTTITWHLVWRTSRPGYGVPDELERSSTVGGKAVVMLQANPGRCPTNFRLLRTNPPTLAQGPVSKSSLVIKVPNPATVSSGAGSGYPSIAVTNPNCAAGLMDTQPPSYTVIVPLHPTTVRRNVLGVGNYNNAGQGKTGSAHMRGTITVTVG